VPESLLPVLGGDERFRVITPAHWREDPMHPLLAQALHPDGDGYYPQRLVGDTIAWTSSHDEPKGVPHQRLTATRKARRKYGLDLPYGAAAVRAGLPLTPALPKDRRAHPPPSPPPGEAAASAASS
jgi:hypothetical protein